MFQKMLHIVNTHFHNIDIIAPVPMNFFKEWWKGYNHSDKIAQRLAKSLRLVCLHLLSKKFFIKRQAVSSRAERLVNIKNVFILNTMYDIKGKNILLIDDITTTGATANECAKVLLNAGARNVFLLTFAKSITDEEIL